MKRRFEVRFRTVAALIALTLVASARAAPTDAFRAAQSMCQTSSEPDQATSACSFVIAHTRDHAALERAYNKRGLAAMRAARYQDAVADFSNVIKLDPKIAGYYDNRQNAYKGLRRFEDALADANIAVRLAPT